METSQQQKEVYKLDSVHVDVRYNCNQCDYKTIWYICDKCKLDCILITYLYVFKPSLEQNMVLSKDLLAWFF